MSSRGFIGTFGFWVQTLADLKFLDLELCGLSERFKIDFINEVVECEGDEEFIKFRIAHLERVNGDLTLYARFVENFGDTNAYAFHNLYPYKGKFYPRLVRSLINAFGLSSEALILDPFNGSGTTTHEASLMGIRSVGIDVTPIGVILAKLKNDLLFVKRQRFNFTESELKEIFETIEKREWRCSDSFIHELMLVLYFDTIDAFERTSRYRTKGKVKLFIDKFNYVKSCYEKVIEIREKYGLRFEQAYIIEGDVLELRNLSEMKERFDACITSPPYYFSIDYVEKDRVAYDYLGIEMEKVKARYLGMRNTKRERGSNSELPLKVVLYYEDLRKAIENIYWALKFGGKLGIVIGDSMVEGKRIPTTAMVRRFCEEVGFKVEKVIYNPLLGVRNRAIRGESVIICTK